jgi:two-component system chemotaxis sensor kinase CheA
MAITTNSIERVLILNKSDMVELEGCKGILIEKHPIPLFLLSDILQFTQEPQPLPDALLIVVIKKDRHTVAFIMDKIIGENELVIKPLQAPLANISSVSGATLSGNGQIIPVLNSMDIINIALSMRKKL